MTFRMALAAVLPMSALGLFGCGGGGGSAVKNPLNQVVFSQAIDDDFELVALNLDTMTTTRLTTNDLDDLDAEFSADGSKIVFRRADSIITMNADGSNEDALTLATSDREPAWSPDGTKIVFTSMRDGNHEIYVMNADGGSVTRLTNNVASDRFPAFSPDGTKIIFVSNVGGDFDVWTMNADGTGAAELLGTPLDEYHPRYNADGSKIVFSQFNSPEYVTLTANSDGAGVTTLATGDAHAPSWGRNGRIAFEKAVGGIWQIFVTDADGTNPVAVTTSSGNSPSVP